MPGGGGWWAAASEPEGFPPGVGAKAVGVGGRRARFSAGERGLHLGSMFPGGAIFVYRLRAVL